MNLRGGIFGKSSNLLRSLYWRVLESNSGYIPKEGVCKYFFSKSSYVKDGKKNFGRFLKQL